MGGLAAEWVALESDALSAAIDPQGAQLSLLRDAVGRDLLWDGDPAIWKGRAPLLFPIVGALVGGSYRLGSNTYRLPRHGFARDRRFEIVRSTRTAAEFELTADQESLRIYPFRFALRVRFELTGPTLVLKTSIRNHGDRPMPASFGYHPALRWPLPFGYERSRHVIEFELEEPAPMRRLDASGLLTPAANATPISNRRLALEDSLFRDDAMIFDQIRSRSATYGADEGPRVRLTYPDAPYLGIWTKPGAPFVCIEPWHGVADPESFQGDLTTKPGIFLVLPGMEFITEMSLTLIDL
jgi:galactose mutarotase-like enzyme